MHKPNVGNLNMKLTSSPVCFPRVLSGSVATLLAGACLGLCFSVTSYGLPVGGQVAAGQAAISSKEKSMTITAGDRSILNFTKFNIAADESVRFVQPSAKSTVLARATDGTPTEIFGRLDANGRVVLANAAGIYFRSGSSISVGGLVAAAGTIADDAFLQNSGQLALRLSGPVENAGQIVAAEHVALLGRTVLNTGSIVAPNGLVALVSGENVLFTEEGGDVAVVQAKGDNTETKDASGDGSSVGKVAAEGSQAGVTHAGKISARSVLLGAGDLYAVGVRHTGKTRAGKVRVEAATKVVVSGEIDVSTQGQTSEDLKPGSIEISGDTVELNGASLLAQGNVRGGNISVTGNEVAVLGGTVLDVSGVDQGSAGAIRISGLNGASAEGSLLARGGENGGDGGVITLVSKGQDILVTGLVTDVSAPAGNSGSVEIVSSEPALFVAFTAEEEGGPNIVARGEINGEANGGAEVAGGFGETTEGAGVVLVGGGLAEGVSLTVGGGVGGGEAWAGGVVLTGGEIKTNGGVLTLGGELGVTGAQAWTSGVVVTGGPIKPAGGVLTLGGEVLATSEGVGELVLNTGVLTMGGGAIAQPAGEEGRPLVMTMTNSGGPSVDFTGGSVVLGNVAYGVTQGNGDIPIVVNNFGGTRAGVHSGGANPELLRGGAVSGISTDLQTFVESVGRPVMYMTNSGGPGVVFKGGSVSRGESITINRVDSAVKVLAAAASLKSGAPVPVQPLAAGFSSSFSAIGAAPQGARDSVSLSAGDALSVGIFRTSAGSQAGDNTADGAASSSEKSR